MSSIQEIGSYDEYIELVESDTLVVIYNYVKNHRESKAVEEKRLPFIIKRCPNVKFAKVDLRAIRRIAEEIEYRTPPFFNYFKNGEKVGESPGADPPIGIIRGIRKLL